MPVEAPLYPVNLVVVGRRCLVVGGGRIGAQKAAELAACGAEVHVVAPRIDAAAAVDGVVCHTRAYEAGEVAGYRLAIAATDDPEVNRQVFLEGEAAGVWVNSADDPANCAFTLPSRLRRGDLLVTFSTGGRSPALATWLRRRFSEEIGPEYLVLMDLLAGERARLRREGVPTEGLDWQGALDSGMLELVREGHLAEAKERLQACLSSSSD
jgi:precorrin-2 dehydrogenase/sirohydrochlorin ferrochelatase